MPGPPPKPADQRVRRNATVATTMLPAEGRKGRTPTWPLIPDVILTAQLEQARELADEAWSGLDDEDLTKSERATKKRQGEKYDLQVKVLKAKIDAKKTLEAKLWRDMWKTPQAVQWEKLRWTRDIAQYVRHKVLGELGSMDDAREARMQADRLGLNSMSLLRLRWEIAEKAAPEQAHGAPAGTSAEDRYGHLQVVADSG